MNENDIIEYPIEEEIQEFPIEEISQEQPKSLLRKAADVGKWAITPIVSPEFISDKPVSAAISTLIPISQFLSGVPRREPFTIPNLVKEGSEQISGQTSPLAIATAPFLTGEVAGVATQGVASSLPLARQASLGLRKGAIKSYKSALGATTIAEKKAAAKLAPELATQKPFAFTRGGFLKKASAKSEEAGEKLGEAYSALGDEATIKGNELLNTIKQGQNELLINGKVPPQNEQAYNAITEIGRFIEGMMNEGKIPIKEIRKYRQLIDDTIAAKKKGFAITGEGCGILDANRLAANSIRRQFSEEYPSIANLNKEFSFWHNLTSLLEKTAPKVKSGIGKVHLGVGDVAGHRGWIGLASDLGRLFSDRTAWRTFSGSMKSRLSDFLAEGKVDDAAKIVSGALKERKQFGAISGPVERKLLPPTTKPTLIPKTRRLQYSGSGKPIEQTSEVSELGAINLPADLAEGYKYLQSYGDKAIKLPALEDIVASRARMINSGVDEATANEIIRNNLLINARKINK